MIPCPHWSPAGESSGKCSLDLYGGTPSHGVCLHVCRHGPREPHPPAPSMSIPRDKWPLLARAVAKLAKPDDKGIGDTVARLVDPLGGETFKVWYERITGESCGCSDRQAKLNALYPYLPTA